MLVRVDQRGQSALLIGLGGGEHAQVQVRSQPGAPHLRLSLTQYGHAQIGLKKT